MAEKMFSAWLFREKGSRPFAVGGQWAEPIEAVEVAEAFLHRQGMANESHIEVRFNGDPKPHYLLFHLGPGRTGIFNTDACIWPIFNIPGMENARDQLVEIPWGIPNDGSKEKIESEDANEKRNVEKAEERKTDEDAKTLDLGAEREQEDEKGSEDADSPEHEDSEEPEEGDNSEDANADSPDAGGSEDRDDGEGGGEDEPVRLKFFAKMRGPKGWRKRADSDPEREINTFQWRIGTVDEDDRESRTPFVNARFRETTDDRKHATLNLRLHPDAEIRVNYNRNEITILIPTQE